MKSITIQCPDELHEDLQQLANAGWVKGPEQAVLEALSRYLQSHRIQVQEAQILSDVKWGLAGNQL